jgi:acetate---CoA ligase (ADP-forming)
VFTTEYEAIAALNQFLSHGDLMQAFSPAASSAPYALLAGPATMLNEADSLALVAKAGVPVVKFKLCHNAEDAVHALAQLGAPVALKGCSADVAHKSELGLVRLGVDQPGQVRAKFTEIKEALLKHGARFDGVIVAQMARGRRELMIGGRVDAVFGPVVLVGDGGKYVEAMPDVQLLLAPFSMAEVRRALARLRIAPLLEGVRGEAALDVAAFCNAALAVSRLMSDRQAGIANLDLNPVLVGAAGEGCVALDAVVYAQGQN